MKKELENLFPTVRGEFDNVSVAAGMIERYSRRNYVNGHEEVTCKNTWRQATTITYQTEDLEQFSTNFAALQTGALGVETKALESDDTATTYATIGSPYFDVCAATRKEMSISAKKLAYEDAMEQYQLSAECCGIEGKPEIEEIGEPGAFSGPKSHYSESSFASERSQILDISINEITVSASVLMKLKFPITKLKCKK